MFNRQPPAIVITEDACSGALQFAFNSRSASNPRWDFGDGTRSTEAAPVKFYARTGNYTITLTVRDSVGCDRTATQNYVANTDSLNLLLVPNVFTPNGDGVNEEFRFTGRGVNCIQWVEVFDRAGRLVFSSTVPNAFWDGRTANGPAPSGVYFYTIKGRDFKRTGNVTLLR